MGPTHRGVYGNERTWSSCAFKPDGSKIVTGAEDKVVIWNAKDVYKGRVQGMYTKDVRRSNSLTRTSICHQ